MTKKQLEIELAEAIVALQYLRILGLRSCLSVSNDELEKVEAPVIRFHNLPTEVREHVIRIRKERWNIS